MKQIEAGCKCVIVNCKRDVGLIVTTIRYVGVSVEVSDVDLWEINEFVSYSKVVSGRVFFSNLISTEFLQRIDEDLSSWDNETFKTLGFDPRKVRIES